MKSLVQKRSVVIEGHKTSVSLEDAFWLRLKIIAAQRKQTIAETIGEVDAGRTNTNLSSAIRLFVLDQCPLAADAVTTDMRVAAPVGPDLNCSSGTADGQSPEI